MTTSWTQIVETMRNRLRTNSPLVDKMVEVRDHYNGDYVLPWEREWAESDPRSYETQPRYTPMLVAEQVDGLAQRAAGVPWMSHFPAIDDGKETGVRSREYAGIRRKGVAYTWAQSMGALARRRFFKQLAAYATFGLLVHPDTKRNEPYIKVLDPLSVYPDKSAPDLLEPPLNVGLVKGMSADQVRQLWPETRQEADGVVPPPSKRGEAEIWHVLEWWDEHERVIGLLGPREPHWDSTPREQEANSQELRRLPNRLGRPPVVVPERPTLDRIGNNLASVLDIVNLQARFRQLELLAVERSIFPDGFIVGSDANPPSLVGGQWRDGRTGEINLVQDASQIGTLRTDPSPMASQAIDRAERDFRVSTGLVPQIGGETFGALRTGRGIDRSLEAALDPRLAELQDVVAAWLPLVNEAIIDTYKAYWPGKKYTAFSRWPSDRGTVEFTPSVHFEISHNAVSYPVPGADAQSLVISLGQMLAARVISRTTFRKQHPFVDDPDAERALVEEELLEEAALQSILQQASVPPQAGGMPLPFLAAIEEARRELKPTQGILDAIREANRIVQEQQATQAPPPDPGQVTAPEEQLGLAAGAAGAAQPPAEVGPPTDSQANLRNVLSVLTSGNRVA